MLRGQGLAACYKPAGTAPVRPSPHAALGCPQHPAPCLLLLELVHCHHVLSTRAGCVSAAVLRGQGLAVCDKPADVAPVRPSRCPPRAHALGRPQYPVPCCGGQTALHACLMD